MENNKPSPVATTNSPQPAVSTPPVTPASSTPIGSNPIPVITKITSGKVLWVVIAIVVVLIIGGGAFWYMNQSRPSNTNPIPVSTAPTASPQDKTITDLKSEVDGLATSDPSTDFTAIDQDLSSL